MNVYLNDAVPVGKFVTLKGDDDTRWEVVAQHETIDAREIKRGWDNNI